MDPSVNGNLLVSQSLKSFEDYLHALNSPPIKVWDLDHWQSRHNIELGSTTYSDAKTIFQGHTGIYSKRRFRHKNEYNYGLCG